MNYFFQWVYKFCTFSSFKLFQKIIKVFEYISPIRCPPRLDIPLRGYCVTHA
jgi:hypothetical protein